MFEKLKEAFQLIETVGAGLGGFILNVTPPETPGRRDVKLSVGLACIIAISLYSMIEGLTDHARKRSRQVIAALLMGIGLAAAIVYVFMFNQMVDGYPKQEPVLYVKGSTLTDAAAHISKKAGGAVTSEHLMRQFGGNPELIWTNDSIEWNRSLLIVTYCVALAGLLTPVLVFTRAWIDKKDAQVK